MIDRKQVITRSTDGSGNVTELWTNSNGGGINLSAVQTVTSADGIARNDNKFLRLLRAA